MKTNAKLIIESLKLLKEYSFKSVNNYNELTDKECEIISSDSFYRLKESSIDSILESNYQLINFPEVQDYQELDGFEDNSFLVHDDNNPSTYAVKTEWILTTHKIISKRNE